MVILIVIPNLVLHTVMLVLVGGIRIVQNMFLVVQVM